MCVTLIQETENSNILVLETVRQLKGIGEGGVGGFRGMIPKVVTSNYIFDSNINIDLRSI
jgi:hypothetical protein